MLNCNAAKKCNSCHLNNLNYEDQLKYKQNKCKRYLGSLCHIDPIVKMDNPFFYRNKAQAVFKAGKDKKIYSGIYKSTTNSPVLTKSCILQTKRTNDVIQTLCCLFKSFKISIYNPYTGKGWLKSVVIREGFNTGEMMVVINGADPIFPAKKTFVSALLSKHKYITTIVTTVNHEKTKLVTGNTHSILYGDGYIKDTLCDKTFLVSPNSFYQINPIQTEKLYKTAIKYAQLDKSKVVLDAYCGVGTIGICASNSAKYVYAVESNKTAVKDAKKNARLNHIDNIEFFADDAKNFIHSLISEKINIDVAFIDPPRAGCSSDFLKSLVKLKVPTIVYISCNVETQSRDVRLLIKNGYKILKCQPFDMFPHTNHVESVVLMTRK